MSKAKQRFTAFLLLSALLFTSLAEPSSAKVKKPKLAKQAKITLNSKKKLKVTGVKKSLIKKTKWKTSNKKIKLKSKKKNSVIVKGVKRGSSRVTARVTLKREKGKKTYRLSCKITIRAKKQKAQDTTKPIVTPGRTAPVKTPLPGFTGTSTPPVADTTPASASASPSILPSASPDTSLKPASPVPSGIPDSLPEAAAVSVPAKPNVNSSYSDTVSPSSSYDLTTALNLDSVKEGYRKYFSIGAAVNGTSAGTSTAASPEMRQVMKRHFNSTTLSNLLKPQYLLDQSGSAANATAGKNDTPTINYSPIVDNLEFCKQSGIKMRGHVLVWHVQTPDWFFRDGFSNTGAYVDKVTMQKRMGSYIRQILEFCQTYYPGVIYCWDVVNEAVDTSTGDGYRRSTWYNIIGKEFIADAFYYARKYADKDVKLFYNDFNTFQMDKNKKIIEIVKPLKEAGLLDGVGMQSYLNSDWPGVASVKTAIQNFAAAGLEIQLTELTYRVPDYNNPTAEDYTKQGQNYQELMNMLIAEDTAGGGTANITNVTFFGLIDNPYSVFGSNPKPDQDCWARLFDQNFKPKPAYYGVMNALTD